MAAGHDYIILGSGIAGLNTALLAREHGSVVILTKERSTTVTPAMPRVGSPQPSARKTPPTSI